MDDPPTQPPTDVPITAGDATPRALGRDLLSALGLLAAVLVVAWPALSAELVYDDLLVVRQNPRITSLANWREAFSATYWEFLEPEVAERVGYWRPLATLLHMGVYAAAGGSAQAFHTASILVHLAAVLAAWRLARLLLPGRAWPLLAALLFGLHPLNVESWAWVSAVNGALAGLFSLLALGSWTAWRRRGSRGVPWAAALAFALALLSKETSLAVVPLAAALDLTRAGSPPRVRLRPLARAYLPLLAVVALYWAGRAAVFESPWAGLDRVTTDFGPDVDVVRLLRLRVELLGGGIGLLALPDPELFRPFRPVIPATDPTFLRDAAVLAALAAALVLAWRARARLLLGALAWLPAALLPVVLRVEALGSFPLSDRFHYVATFGAALLAAHVARTRLPSAVGAALLVALVAGAGWASRARTAPWQDEEALFRTALAESPETPYVHWGLGRVLLNRYREEGDPADLAEALEVFEASADLLQRGLEGDASFYATRQDAEQTNVGLGWCYLFEAEASGTGDYDTPRAIFELALEGSPDSENAYTGLGVALQAQGRRVEARAAYESALALNPKHAPAHHNFALLLLESEELRRAEHHLEEALRHRPDHVEDLLLLAEVRGGRGDTAGAREAAERALRLAPGRPEPHTALAALAGRAGDHRAALAHLDDALRADPEHGRAHYLRGLEFVQLGEASSAVSSFRRAAELSPGDFDAHYNLAALLLASGAVEGALPYLTRAYALAREPAVLERLRATLAGLPLENPEEPYAWARIDLGRGAPEPAGRWVERSLAADGDFAPALYLRARTRRRSGELDGAVSDLERYLALVPGAYEPRIDLAEIHLEAGREEEARDVLTRAIELGPPEAWEEGLRQAARRHAESLLSRLAD